MFIYNKVQLEISRKEWVKERNERNPLMDAHIILQGFHEIDDVSKHHAIHRLFDSKRCVIIAMSFHE